MPPYTPTRRDWLLLTAAGAFKFTLVGFTLVAVMTMLKTYGYTLKQLSWVFLLGSVEAAKVLFAIVIERYCPARGGRFRFWLLVSLAGIAASLVLLMLLDPRRHFFLLLPVLFVLSCFSVLFGSASVGLGSLLLPYRARGHGGVIQVVAARAGKMIGGAGVLWIFQQYGWTSAIAAMLAFTFAVSLQTAAYREPEAFRQPASAWRLSNLFKRLALFWRDTPRGKTWFVLLFASCIPYAATATTFTPELTDLGWTPKQIGTVLTAVIPLACMAATPAAGLLARKYSRRAAPHAARRANRPAQHRLHAAAARGYGRHNGQIPPRIRHAGQRPATLHHARRYLCRRFRRTAPCPQIRLSRRPPVRRSGRGNSVLRRVAVVP